MGGSGDRVWPSASLTLTVNGAQMAFARTGERDSTAADVPTLSGASNHAREYKVTLKCDSVVPRVETQPGKTRGMDRKPLNLARSRNGTRPGRCAISMTCRRETTARDIRRRPPR
jgi:hypothetical protein